MDKTAGPKERLASRLFKNILRAFKFSTREDHFTPEGLLHFKQAPAIKGKCDYGKKAHLTFVFDDEKEMQFVQDFFRGRSRIPDGHKLFEFLKRHGAEVRRLADDKPA